MNGEGVNHLRPILLSTTYTKSCKDMKLIIMMIMNVLKGVHESLGIQKFNTQIAIVSSKKGWG